jgi:hypothetical protein
VGMAQKAMFDPFIMDGSDGSKDQDNVKTIRSRRLLFL